MIQSNKPVAITKLVGNIAGTLCETYCNQELCLQYAWWVLEAILHTKKSELLLQDTILLSPKQVETLQTWIEQQVKEQIPLQYLIGTVPFADAQLMVEPPLPIPRAETEEWVTNFIAALQNKKITPASILDLGTGTGCIAIALAQACKKTELYASDISKQALELARKNAIHNNVEIQFLQSDLFEDIPSDLQFDIIISNPPYVSPQEWKQVDAAVRNWETSTAHVASDNGLSVIKAIVAGAQKRLAPNTAFADTKTPNLLIEIGHNQANDVKKIFQEHGYQHILVHKDLYGKDRLVSGYIDVWEKKE